MSNVIGITSKLEKERDESSIKKTMIAIKTFNPLIEFGIKEYASEIKEKHDSGTRIFIHLVYQSDELTGQLVTKEKMNEELMDCFDEGDEFIEIVGNYDMENTIPVYFEHTKRTKYFTVVTNLPWAKNRAKILEDVNKAYILK